LTDLRRDRAVCGVYKEFPQTEVGYPRMRP
jgi:hypothetical protein